MDLATLLGMLGAIAVIVAAIVFGGSASSFVDTPSLLIVLGGGMFANLVKFPLSDTLGAVKIASRAFRHKIMSSQELIAECVDLSKTARREGLLELENKEITNEFLNKGVQMAIDGVDHELVKYLLNKEINMTIERHETGEAIFKGFGESFPAMGMIGTLIGLVQMMSNMDDPKAIGPAMAVALLTTLYGAVLANTIALPIAEKLAFRTSEERRNRQLILEAVHGIQTGIQPRVLETLLSTYVPNDQRGAEEGAKAA